MDKDKLTLAKTGRKLPKLYIVPEKRLIDLLAKTECSKFEETLKNPNYSNDSDQDEAPESSNTVEENLNEAVQTSEFEGIVEDANHGDICNDAEWCPLSVFRLKAQIAEYRPCNLNFSFHVALITHKMLNIFEDEEETDLHDFLSNEDLCIMSRHQSDEDQEFTLIFQPKYEIRPDCKRVVEKLEEYVNPWNMRFGVDVTEDGDFFADSWLKSPFHGVCKAETAASSKSAKKSNKTKK